MSPDCVESLATHDTDVEPLVRVKGNDGGGALHCVTWEYIEKKD